MNSLLCCYFPTKVIFVDDNSSILRSLAPMLDHNLATYDFFDNPYKALEFVNNCHGIDFLPSAFPMREQRNDEIYKAIFSPQRYEEVSTVIVDYEMPSMKGLEFCEKLQNPYIRKILYTGVADEKVAIEAFNKGLIDGYIRKQDKERDIILNNFIRQSQLKYFKALTDISIEAILKNEKNIEYDDYRAAPFYDPSFNKYFNELIEKNNISEYYFNESINGFIFLTPKGKLSTLFTVSEEMFEDLHWQFIGDLEKAAATKKQISSSFIKDLEENSKLLCFPFCGNEQNPAPENWEKYAYPLEILRGRNIYYVAYASDIDYISSSEICSFEKYQRKNK